MVWFKLLRIAALPSAISNILVGYLLASGSWQPGITLVWLLLASACIYSAGMVLNDVFDFEIDAKERPNRPIPSGAVSLDHARWVGFCLLFFGAIFALLASINSFMVAIVLAMAVYAYDGPLKRTVAAPFVMGLCRMLNFLLGASAAANLSPIVIAYSLAIGIFIAGVTWLARHEAREHQSHTTLIPGGVLMAAGLVLAGCVMAGCFDSAVDVTSNPKVLFAVVIAFLLVSLPVVGRLAIAVTAATSSAVQMTVVTSLRSLILFDAIVALLVESGRPFYSLVIVSLLGASWLLRKASSLT